MTEIDNSEPVQPILVVLVWRGGARFQRALESIRNSEKYFKRIIISITSTENSEDMQIARRFLKDSELNDHPSRAEIICTGHELPTMKHQAFWIDYLKETGVSDDEWIYWLAYDDQLNPKGILKFISSNYSWPLNTGTTYLGPWIMRHEGADQLWAGDLESSDEVWTALSAEEYGPVNCVRWVLEQLTQPTYLQMSGSISSLKSHRQIATGLVHKRGPMRIEMATAIAGQSAYVAETPFPTSIIYGRSNSDRSMYGRKAYWEDLHLIHLLLIRALRNPDEALAIFKFTGRFFMSKVRILLGRQAPIQEEWRKV